MTKRAQEAVLERPNDVYISIRISSYNKIFMYYILHGLQNAFSGKFFFSIFKLPEKRKTFTLLRSPFVNKKSRIQLGFRKKVWLVKVVCGPANRKLDFTDAAWALLEDRIRGFSVPKFSCSLKFCKKSNFF